MYAKMDITNQVQTVSVVQACSQIAQNATQLPVSIVWLQKYSSTKPYALIQSALNLLLAQIPLVDRARIQTVLNAQPQMPQIVLFANPLSIYFKMVGATLFAGMV